MFNFETTACKMIFWAIVAIVVLGIFGCITKIKIVTAYIENGYTKQTLQGSGISHWIKIE